MGILQNSVGTDRTGTRFPTLPRHLLPRPGLIAQLDDASPLTVVSGIQGYGKTTLLASWAWARAGMGLPTVWLNASAPLNSPQAFESALRREWSEVAKDVPLHSTADDERLWSARADDPCEVVIVVDNFQEIEDPSVIRYLLELPRLNRGLRIVVSTRRQHTIDKLAASDIEMRVILSRELLLSPDEIVELSRIVGRPMNLDVATGLHQVVGGWISAVRIVLELYREDAPLPLAAVREYFSTKVFPTVRDEFVLGELMRFSLPDVLDVSMVKGLARDSDPEDLLSALERPGLFERRYVFDKVELHLPSLVQELLREKFTTMPEAARAAHREFAVWFENADSPEDLMAAFEHAVHAHEWPMAMRLWRDHGTLFMSYPQRFGRALTAMPEDIVATERGASVTLQSFSVFSNGISDGVDGTAAWFRAYAQACTRALAEGGDSLDLRDFLHFAPGALVGLRAQGRFSEAVALATRAFSSVSDRLAKGENPGDRLSWFYLHVGLTYRVVGEEVAAIPIYQLAWEHGARSRVRAIEANAAASLGLLYAYRSDPRRAELWLDRQRRISTAGHWAHHLVMAPAQVARALLKLDALDDQGTRDELSQIDDAMSTLDAWQSIAYASAQHALHFGDADSALAALSDAENAHGPRRTGEQDAFVLLSRARADLLLMTGRVHEALSIVAEQPDNLLLTVPRARAHLLSGEHQQARLVISAGLWNPNRRMRDRLEMLLIDAVCAVRLGEPEAAKVSILRALELVRSSGNLRALSTIGRSDLEEALRLAGAELTDQERAAVDSARSVYPDQVRAVSLTDRERSLILALEAGATRQEMAEMLFVSINTVKTQLAGLYEKLGVTSKSEALRKAHLLRLI